MKDRSRFEKEVVVKEEDLDELNHVNNMVYIQWTQDIAKEHWFAQVPPELNSKYFWIVIFHNVKYKRPCFLGERIKIETQVGEIDGAKWPRNVWIYKEDGSLAVEAITGWCLMDKERERPARVTEEIAKVFI